ncbi:MAG: hypothetical protein U5K72_15445 [Balneolaceae bacterium]|nr:hypothetical protein [Balneolaceae bacterium]
MSLESVTLPSPDTGFLTGSDLKSALNVCFVNIIFKEFWDNPPAFLERRILYRQQLRAYQHRQPLVSRPIQEFRTDFDLNILIGVYICTGACRM